MADNRRRPREPGCLIGFKPGGGAADAVVVGRRARRVITRQVRSLVLWPTVALLLWALQLLWLYHRLGRPTWSEYWRWRAVYRPGIRTIEHHAGDHLPGHFFSALSPTGAKWAFILSAGLYACAGAGLIWLLWLITRLPRRAAGRRLRRAVA